MQQPNARANLVGVARKAGVHPSTASRALSDNPVRVSPATVERVRKSRLSLGITAMLLVRACEPVTVE